jgi:hypothetical protein
MMLTQPFYAGPATTAHDFGAVARSGNGALVFFVKRDEKGKKRKWCSVGWVGKARGGVQGRSEKKRWRRGRRRADTIGVVVFILFLGAKAAAGG